MSRQGSLELGVSRDHAATTLRLLTVTPRLHTLDSTTKQLAIDKERSHASIALCKSGQRLISSVHRKTHLQSHEASSYCSETSGLKGTRDVDLSTTDGGKSCGYASDRCGVTTPTSVEDVLAKAVEKPRAADNNKPKVAEVSAEPAAIVASNRPQEDQFPPLDAQLRLADAFWAFDENDDGDMSLEELITLLSKCNMFDGEFLSKAKVRIYMASLLEGCNEFERVGNANMAGSGIGLPQFEEVLTWIALMKGVSYDECLAKLLAQAKVTCGNTLHEEEAERHLPALWQQAGAWSHYCLRVRLHM